jgi:hypothetical protein
MTILNKKIKKHTHKGGVIYKAYVVINGEVKLMNINSNSSNNGNNQSLSGEIINSDGNNGNDGGGGGGASKLTKVEKKHIMNKDLYNEIYNYLTTLNNSNTLKNLKQNALQNNLSEDIKVKLIDIDRESLQIILNYIYNKFLEKEFKKYIKLILNINTLNIKSIEEIRNKRTSMLNKQVSESNIFFEEHNKYKRNDIKIFQEEYIKTINQGIAINKYIIEEESIIKEYKNKTDYYFEKIINLPQKKINYFNSILFLYETNKLNMKININYFKKNILEIYISIFKQYIEIFFIYETEEIQNWGFELYSNFIKHMQ